MCASHATRDALFEQGSDTFDSSLSITTEQFVTSVEALAPGFGRLIIEMEFGDIYNRPGLDLKTRELVIIASCAALGITGFSALKMHVPAALRHGATRAEIIESLVQVAMAAGLPTSLGALQAAKEAFDELDSAHAAQ
ncbi:carboxymuconolactone decarboxylase family protein [Pseudomonas sp. RIT-To-2]|uniref:carboxymuconolactone decarboxylase family protein n=1 Tax=Pseudomonas sp. RIT-To-2 TaxID=3462541 RepID=UPI0024131EEA